MATATIAQSYELYSDADHDVWRRLYARMIPYWARYANRHFLKGIELLHLNPNRVPRLDEVNRFLGPLTGFQAKPVGGYVPATEFFDCLRRREFPTTITIRSADRLDYLPEPDIFHDVAGHVPMHTDPAFAEALVLFGDCARRAEHPGAVLAMARFFWFSIEFGLMREGGELKAYGSGLLSSHGELRHAIESPHVRREPFEIERVVNQPFEIDHYQPLLFVVKSFDHLFELVRELDQWMRAGKLDNVRDAEHS